MSLEELLAKLPTEIGGEAIASAVVGLGLRGAQKFFRLFRRRDKMDANTLARELDGCDKRSVETLQRIWGQLFVTDLRTQQTVEQLGSMTDARQGGETNVNVVFDGLRLLRDITWFKLGLR